MKYKAVIADVDGTLIAPNAHPTTQASPRIIEAVEKAKQKGVAFSLATARSLDWIEGLRKSLHIVSPVILDNGARIYDCKKEKYIYKAFLSSEEVKKVLNIFSSFGKPIRIVDEKSRFQYIGNLTDSRVIKIMVLHIDPKLAHRIFQEVSKLPDVAVTKSISGENPTVESIHVTASSASKEETLVRLSEYMKIPLHEFIGIGDSYNDAGFLNLCGLKVAVENAVPEVKAIADYIAPSYDKDGVADVIEKFIL